jgi:hypothetical protein
VAVADKLIPTRRADRCAIAHQPHRTRRTDATSDVGGTARRPTRG